MRLKNSNNPSATQPMKFHHHHAGTNRLVIPVL